MKPVELHTLYSVKNNDDNDTFSMQISAASNTSGKTKHSDS